MPFRASPTRMRGSRDFIHIPPLLHLPLFLLPFPSINPHPPSSACEFPHSHLLSSLHPIVRSYCPFSRPTISPISSNLSTISHLFQEVRLLSCLLALKLILLGLLLTFTSNVPSPLPSLSALRRPVLPRCIFLCVISVPSVSVFSQQRWRALLYEAARGN